MKIVYTISVNDPKARAVSYQFAFDVRDDATDEAIVAEVRERVLREAVNIKWQKVKMS